MINGSWKNKNQFPSANFPEPIQVKEVGGEEDDEEEEEEERLVVHALSVDGNGTGGLMKRSKATGGKEASLMVPSDLKPDMRMVTPIDSGRKAAQETRNIFPSSPTATYATLSALTATIKSTASPSLSDAIPPKDQQTMRTTRLVPFQGSSVMEESTNDKSSRSASQSTNHNIKTKLVPFEGNSVMNEQKEGLSKKGSSKSLDESHHRTISSGSATNTRLVPFVGSSLMEAARKNTQHNQRIQRAKLVPFQGSSVMEQEFLESQRKEHNNNIQTNTISVNKKVLRPAKTTSKVTENDGSTAISKASASSPPTTTDVDTNDSNDKVVLYNKKAAVASSLLTSKRREYYHLQYRPPTDATMARKTGLLPNTPISLWNERDKFLDYESPN
jgi:hypothetical protein